MSGIGLPQPVKPRKRRRIATAYQAQRIRFGILAARHTLARGTMTPDQVDYLEGCEAVGWIIGDAGTVKAYDREVINIQRRGGRRRYSFRAHRLSLRMAARG